MKRITAYSILILLLIINYTKIMAQQTVSRKDLLFITLDEQKIAKVEIKEVTIPAGGKASYHLHPCPVVGTVVSGAVYFQIEGQPAEIIKAGAAFYEPKNQPILHFDNASDTEPLIFTAFYLLEGDEDIITILPSKE